uniref:Protein vein n=1 Tax=Cacopsylla melanoneura TaxID=428564 RepID=A0A8D9EVC8_9HEMI
MKALDRKSGKSRVSYIRQGWISVLLVCFLLSTTLASTTPIHFNPYKKLIDDCSKSKVDSSELNSNSNLKNNREELMASHSQIRSPFLKRSGRIARSPLSRSQTTQARRRGFNTANSWGFSRNPGNSFKSLRSSDSSQSCFHIGDGTNEVSARALLATTVFEGKARSRSPRRGAEGDYGVTFVVQHVYKEHNSHIPLKPHCQVRLRFLEKYEDEFSSDNKCVQSYNFTTPPGELVRTNIKRGGKYIVFMTGNGPHNFSALGEPVIRTEKNVMAVKHVLCHNCLHPIEVSGLRNVSVKLRQSLRLVCRCKGNPLPAVSWFKDNVEITTSKRLKIQFKKKRSTLIITRIRSEDAGRYECRGTGVHKDVVSAFAEVSINFRPDSSNSFVPATTLWPLVGGPCPLDSYCLNGGSCTYYDTVGELVCQCAEGYKGQRCESKDVYNRSSMYKPYFCKLGISASYYC